MSRKHSRWHNPQQQAMTAYSLRNEKRWLGFQSRRSRYAHKSYLKRIKLKNRTLWRQDLGLDQLMKTLTRSSISDLIKIMLRVYFNNHRKTFFFFPKKYFFDKRQFYRYLYNQIFSLSFLVIRQKLLEAISTCLFVTTAEVSPAFRCRAIVIIVPHGSACWPQYLSWLSLLVYVIFVVVAIPLMVLFTLVSAVVREVVVSITIPVLVRQPAAPLWHTLAEFLLQGDYSPVDTLIRDRLRLWQLLGHKRELRLRRSMLGVERWPSIHLLSLTCRELMLRLL